MKIINILLSTKKTVFSTGELKQLFKKENGSYINTSLQPLKKSGILINPMKSIRSFKEYDILELGAKLKSQSYISFETVLQQAGVIFQTYEYTITLASDNTVTKHVVWADFTYHKIKNTILTNPMGIYNHENKYMIASPERAVCDMVYLYHNIYFDNLTPLNADLIDELAPIYPKTTILLLKKLADHVRSSTT